MTPGARRRQGGTARRRDGWIFEEALRRWPGVEHDAAGTEFLAMIEKARPHGWIDDARKAIKAHIEWVG